MNINQHRKMVQSLTAEAEAILAQLVQELQAEGPIAPEDALAIGWTGQVRVFGQSVWHEFKTPGSWAGFTYYRLAAVGEGLKSREPVLQDMRSPREGRGDSDYPGLDLQG